MGIHNRSLILFAMLFALLLVEPVCAFNLGTLQKTTSYNVTSGETVQFDILFWNTEAIGYNLQLEIVHVPKDWVVISDPSMFYLDNNYSGKIEHMYISRLKKTVNAALVNVYVYVPKSEKLGKYTVVLKAVAGEGDSISGFSLRQERTFFFDVYVTEDLYLDAHNDEIESKSVSIDIKPIINHKKSDVLYRGSERPVSIFQYMKGVIFLLIIIMILWIARRIYEYD
ncbi:MAG: hypothetical protein K0B07_00050 [DPANN group archaeon]|nr:hypothetical protein [DPANN group archaeon]